jgi:hypothetical protein
MEEKEEWRREKSREDSKERVRTEGSARVMLSKQLRVKKTDDDEEEKVKGQVVEEENVTGEEWLIFTSFPSKLP